MRLNHPSSLSALITCLMLTSSAHAGPVEQFGQVAFDPRNSKVIAVRFLNGGEGLFYSRDGGKSWQMQCATGVESTVIHLVPMAIAGDGKSVIGGELGRPSGNNKKVLFQDDGQGCGWTEVPEFSGRTVTNLTPHPTDPDVMFASVSDQKQPNGLRRRDAKGVWRDFGTSGEPYVTRLVIAKTAKGLRIYETAFFLPPDALDADGGALPWTNWLRISNDDGDTWQEQPFGSPEQPLELLAVDPTNPDRLVAIVKREGAADTLFVSSDQGSSFTEYTSLSEFGGFAFAPDGRAWIGDAGNPLLKTAPKGLWFAKSLDEPATRIAEYPVACVGYHGAAEQLYACRLVPGADAFGSVDGADGTFKSLLTFGEVEQFVECAGVDGAASCKTQLCGAYCGFGHFADAPLCAAYNEPSCGPCAADSSLPGCGSDPVAKDAGIAKDAGRVDEPRKSDGCGCRTLGRHTHSSGRSALFGLLGLTFVLGTRRRQKPKARRPNSV